MQKILSKTQKSIKTLNLLSKNTYSVLPNSRVKHFDSFKELQDYLKDTRPHKHAVFAGADWNPLSEQAQQDFQEISNKYNDYEFISFSSDVLPQAKAYFAVRCEPETILLNLGSEMTRQTGQDKQQLESKFQKVNDHFSSLNFIPGTDKYENFEDEFMAEYMEHDYEFDWWAR